LLVKDREETRPKAAGSSASAELPVGAALGASFAPPDHRSPEAPAIYPLTFGAQGRRRIFFRRSASHAHKKSVSSAPWVI
jgi:hypothetical protein